MSDKAYRIPGERIELRLQRAPWYGGANILVKEGGMIGVSIEMQSFKENEVVDPTFKIDDKAAQTLMDDLWNAGYRPTEGSGSAGSLRATEKHLADMRKLVSKKLGVDL